MAFQATFKSAGKVLPTTANLKNALRNANDPDYSKRDSRELQAMIAALPEADLDVFADVNTRRNNLLGYDTTVQAQAPAGEPSPPDIELERAAAIDGRYKRSGLSNENGTFMNGMFGGATAADLVWSSGVDAHEVVDYKIVDGIDLKIDPSAPLGISKYVYTGDDYSLQPYTDPAAVIIARYNPMKGMNSGYEGGLLRSAIYPTILKWYAMQDWGAINEKWGNSPVIVSYPRNIASNKDEVDKVLTLFNELSTNKGAVIPEDIKVAVMGLKDLGVNIDSFQMFMNVIRSAQSRIILGNDVSNIAQKEGTYAQAKEASKSTETHNWHDIFWLQKVLDQYVRADYTLNYGEPTTGLFPRFKFVTDEGEDFAKNSIVAETLNAMGYELDPEELSRKTGFTIVGKRTQAPLGLGA